MLKCQQLLALLAFSINRIISCSVKLSMKNVFITSGSGIVSYQDLRMLVCSLVVTCWERADLLVVVCVVFCHFTKPVLVHIRIKDEVGAVKLI